MQCQNVEFCKGHAPFGVPGMPRSRLCGRCGLWAPLFQWGVLTFVRRVEQCAICLEDKPLHVMFPANCTHYFCTECMYTFFHADILDFDLGKEMYGCPRCPGGCHNPIVGKQCVCPCRKDTEEQWRRDEEDLYDAWLSHKQQMLWHILILVASQTFRCPVCRAEYRSNFFTAEDGQG